jgi:AraC-like DNA-binding protein
MTSMTGANRYELRLQLHLQWVRSMLKPDEFSFGPVINPFPVFWVVLEGTREIEVAGNRYRISPGNLILFPQGVPYRLDSDTSGECFHYLSLGCDVNLGPFALTEVHPIPLITTDHGPKELEALIQRWKRLVERFEQLTINTSTLAKTISPMSLPDVQRSIAWLKVQKSLHQWFIEYLALHEPYIPETAHKLDTRIMEACVYIREHVHEAIRLEDLASHVHLSPSYFNYLFRRTLGLPPIEYLRNYRIQLGKELLIRTHLTVNEISLRVGYHDQSQFSRAFRKMVERSPLAYRTAWQRGEPC